MPARALGPRPAGTGGPFGHLPKPHRDRYGEAMAGATGLQLLIDQIVRQTTVLVAQVATAGGARAPLAHVANQVFVDLANELAEQGVSRKVGADMFGMALRAYVRKVRRLGESATERGHTLWQAMLDHVAAHGPVTRRSLIERFAGDGESQVRAILHDLVEVGLVTPEGSGETARFRVPTASERDDAALPDAGFDELVWVTIYRNGPLERSKLADLMPREPARVTHAIDRLIAAQRVECIARDGQDHLVARDFTIALGERHGWEAAVLDHFQAVVQTICQRLRGGAHGTALADTVGGSTYSYDVWPGHPLEAEVRESLRRLRGEHTRLRERVDAHNRRAGRPASYDQVVLYAGQCSLPQGDADDNDAN